MTEKRQDARRLSPWWRAATILVMIAGFSVLSVVTVLTYSNAPPIPARVTDPGGGAPGGFRTHHQFHRES